MKYLLIESCTERGLVAVLDDNSLIESLELPFGFQNSRYLLPAIATFLQKHEVEAVAAGVGPGSYTGIRVGTAAAKAIAYSRKLPLVGICTLKGFVPEINGRFAAVVDAKIGGIYLLKGEKRDKDVVYLSEPMLCSITSVEEWLSDVEFLCTPNATVIRPRLEKTYPENKWKWIEMAPSPKDLNKEFQNKINESPSSLDYHLDLLYLRKTQAELEREQNLID